MKDCEGYTFSTTAVTPFATPPLFVLISMQPDHNLSRAGLLAVNKILDDNAPSNISLDDVSYSN